MTDLLAPARRLRSGKARHAVIATITSGGESHAKEVVPQRTSHGLRIGRNNNEILTLRGAMVRLEAETVRSTSPPGIPPPVGCRGENEEQLAGALAG